ncbi:hypothetical protein [Arthrobacter sp. Alg241-R88]|uniref:hypothetical protein n=1 Tax=Arthrobacter sp. Alg241-R88 TaxID=2305984 RepID=UPI0013D85F9C|nr:hypothetical protein [Arthrobacter sp. Alg241-R88]
MDSGLLTAAITASFALAGSLLASLIAAVASLKTQRGQAKNNEELILLKNRLDTDSRDRERQLSGKAELDKLREPLLRAAEDLRQRIWNIREDNFLTYLHGADAHRRELALLGTMHRFARYWAWQQLLYSRVHLLQFETDQDTKNVGKLVGSIASSFATDRYSDGLYLIFWREEQRAVAELMVNTQTDNSIPEVTEFASFARRYKEDEERESQVDFARWLSTFSEDLKSEKVMKSQRLSELEAKLTRLVQELETGRTGSLRPEISDQKLPDLIQ